MSNNKVWLEIAGNSRSAITAVQALMSSLGSASAEASKASTNMCSSFAGVTKSIIAATGATNLISSSVSSLIGLFKQGFTAVDKYKTGVATLAAFTLTFMEDQQAGDIGKQWDVANKYAKDLYTTLERVGAQTLMTGEQAVMLGQEFLKNGVAIDGQNEKQVKGLETIANALFVVTGGHNVELQIITEIDHLLKGQVTAQDRLGKLLQAADPLLKQHLETWVKEGTVIEHIGRLLKGFDMATGELAGSWEAVKSTLSSTVDQVLRNGMKPVYQDIIQLTLTLNEYLSQHREEIKTRILNAYKELKGIIEVMWATSKKIYDLWQEYGMSFKNTVAAIGTAIAVQWVTGLIQAEKFMISLVALGQRFLPFLVAYAVWKAKDTIDNTDKKDVMVGHAVEKVQRLQAKLDTAKAINSSRVTEIAMELASAERERDELLLLYRTESKFVNVKAGASVKPPPFRKKGDESDPALKKAEFQAELAMQKAYSDQFLDSLETAYKTKLLTSDEYYAARKQQVEDEARLELKIVESMREDLGVEKDPKKKQIAALQLSTKEVEIETKKVKALNDIAEKRDAELRKQQEEYNSFLDQHFADFKTGLDKELSALEANYAEAASKDVQNQQLQTAMYEQYLKDKERLTREYNLKIADAERERNQKILDSTLFMQNALNAMKVERGDMTDLQARQLGVDYERQSLELKLKNLEADRQAASLVNDKEKEKQIEGDILTIKNQQITAQERLNQLKREEPRTFGEGFSRGFKDFLIEASDTYKQGVEFAYNAARAMQDAFSDFFFDAMTGKLKTLTDYWKSFSQTILKYISEILAKQAMVGLFGDGKSSGGMLGGLLGLKEVGGGTLGGGWTPLHTGGMITPKFHFGGLQSDERLAINKVGERYITAEQNEWLTKLSKNMSGQSSSLSISVPISINGEATSRLKSELRAAMEKTALEVIKRHS